MAEIENQSQFAQDQVEQTEIEKLQERVRSYRATLSPQSLPILDLILQGQLKAGLIKLEELDAMVLVRDDIRKAQLDHKTYMENQQRRLVELQEEEQLELLETQAKFKEQEKQKLVDERVARKNAEARVHELEKKMQDLKKGISNVVSVSQPQETKPVEMKSTGAFALARSMNPKDEDDFDLDRAPSKPISQDGDFVEKVEDTKKAFKEFTDEVQEQKSLDDAMLEANKLADTIENETVLDVPEDAPGTEEFYEEVESVANEETQLDMFEDEIPDLKIAEEDTESQPNFTKTDTPVISNAKVPSALEKEIKTYDSVEDLQAAVDEKNKLREEEAEEEFEEITIPSESELKQMTKSEIKTLADTLEFGNVSMSDTKTAMIVNFLDDAQAFIKELQDAGEFVSATEEGDEDGDTTDRQDGGYF